MEKYRISKYNPDYRDEKGVFLQDEWTSYYDIGRIFNGEELTLEEYEQIERKYCSVLMAILVDNSVDVLNICNLEKYIKERTRLTKQEMEIIEYIEENTTVSIENICNYIKLILKEYFWCVIITKDEIKIEFGYDYYVYVTCPQLKKEFIDKYEQEGIFIEIVKL